ncbi:hypothetical protein EDF77_2599 [Stenotrophomonas maltophilia]|uniref:hypothetical protein n=1 Tax=Stenotrophomonas chelatiphaga TaxID=517011 RepID=UPI000F4B3C71|nr:hypothetical protein [Stenotrophomonas chelatiphaga]MCS4230773.1 hypothetical protein [Stenotrophomonas chelatiphaga]ROQ40267.1 hypothetical protein EDF77_2599 [Stenotrophomonas maltophilia]
MCGGAGGERLRNGFHVQAGVFVAQLRGHVVQDENVRLGALACAFPHPRQPGEHPAPGKQCVVIRSDVDRQRSPIGQYPAAEHFQAQRIEGVSGPYLRNKRCVDGIHHAGVTPVSCHRHGHVGSGKRRAQWPQRRRRAR